MKFRLLLIVLLFTTFSFGQHTTFNIKYSEPLAVFVFMQHLSESYPVNVFKTAFEKSRYIDKYKDAVAKFDKLALDYSYQFDEFPYASKIPMQTRDILHKNLIEANNLNDFKIRSIGIVPIKTLNDLTENIASFTPIYNELIYEPNKEKFERQMDDIRKFANDHEIGNYFEVGLQFYNSTWDNSIPFQISLYPLPNSSYFSGQAFYNNFICAIQTNLKDYKDLFSVMLHEIYHILYDEQSLEVKVKIDTYFKQSESKVSNYAFQILNEVLATALGNGYVYEKLAGKSDANDWYSHKYINLLARKVYPLVTAYVSQGKGIDKNFIDNYIQLYAVNFPNWINELENILSYRYVITDNENNFEAIKRMFRYRSREERDKEITESSIEKMKGTNLTKVIIVSKDSKEKLKLIKRKFKELQRWQFNSDKEFVYKINLEDKSQLIIVNQRTSTLEALLKLNFITGGQK